MFEFEIGKPFPLPIPRQEGVVFSVEPFSCLLIYYYNRPTPQEISEFREGSVSLSVTEMKDILIFQSRFGQMSWADAFYSADVARRREDNIAPEESYFSSEERTLPELREGQRGYALDAFMVDRVSGILQAHRLVRMPWDFSLKFRVILQDHQQRRLSDEAFEQGVGEILRAFSTRELLKRGLVNCTVAKPQVPAPQSQEEL